MRLKYWEDLGHGCAQQAPVMLKSRCKAQQAPVIGRLVAVVLWWRVADVCLLVWACGLARLTSLNCCGRTTLAVVLLLHLVFLFAEIPATRPQEGDKSSLVHISTQK